jgi:hypothetical protein
MPKRTTFPTVELESIRHLLPQAAILDSEDAAAICLNCGHPAADHNFDYDTCWHVLEEKGAAGICKCEGWMEQGTREEIPN